MKSISCWLMCISGVLFADNSGDHQCIENIKKESTVIVDKIFAQGVQKIEAKEDILKWLCDKKKEEFTDIQNLMSDLNIAINFDRAEENIIQEELQKGLQNKIYNEANKILATDGMTPENMRDFFHMSRLVCDAMLGSDERCRKIMRSFKQEYCSDIKKLKIIDKAQMKIKKEEEKQQKKELLHQLREQIVLGTSPRK
ncbi:MAG TPA: hypothetical protein VHX42_02060 [Candidatus Babeliales bacterium]|nr:hypothetical protein [Candidatus Babeliales bacterium]